MNKTKQSGFAIIETVVILLVLAVIGGTGYYVWHRSHTQTKKSANNQQTSDVEEVKAHLGKNCTAGEMKGKLYTAPKAAYSICIPNGWKLSGPSNGLVLVGEATGLGYLKNIAPQVDVYEGGGDGATAFAVYYNTTASGEPSGFTTVGRFAADNVTGTEYARTETRKDNGVGLGAVAKGTQQRAYYFENGGKSIEIDYNLFPGDTDHTDQVAAVAKTLIFN